MSFTPYRQIGEPRTGGIVLVSDHASNAVPEGIELGVSAATMESHIAVDIGVEGVAERMARRHDIPAFLATISRLVVDLHREEDHPGMIPEESDGKLIVGNIGADRDMRLAKFYRPYHTAMERWLEAAQPRLIISLHSFTPSLESKPEQERPWEVGLLYNTNSEPARHAIRLFAAQGLTVGDNEPYSGRELNATMNRHAEAKGRDYLAIEVRNDQIATEADQARWAALIADVAQRTVLAMG
ncbi:N-formylglutamate amidohydrolase [Croceicoccus gelatinilyticus]|uniref:N-formylglutamate amidohydrolase n=1 Tax=Croceicoccus gelatinilyticus TaxID=2835536 RepID=UPI001BCD1203|nr:N-formylglutamate amidohydrolase [Croceicoccus gelatinilyticus]MBS7670431.1 N-formylglutamate amidohydrolase [Croceicoccus gelatinilyticus]